MKERGKTKLALAFIPTVGLGLRRAPVSDEFPFTPATSVVGSMKDCGRREAEMGGLAGSLARSCSYKYNTDT